MTNAIAIDLRPSWKLSVKIPRWLSTLTRLKASGNSSVPTSQPVSPSLKWYHSIDEMPLPDFEAAVCDNKPFGNWENLYQQYCDRVRDKQQEYVQKLAKEINLLEAQYNLVQLIVKRLETEFSQQVFSMLGRIMMVKVSVKTYTRDLQIIASKSKKLLFNIEKKRKELQDLTPAESGDEPITRKYFTAWIIQLSKHTGVQLNRHTMMTGEFCDYICDLRDAVDNAKIKAAKNGRK